MDLPDLMTCQVFGLVIMFHKVEVFNKLNKPRKDIGILLQNRKDIRWGGMKGIKFKFKEVIDYTFVKHELLSVLELEKENLMWSILGLEVAKVGAGFLHALIPCSMSPSSGHFYCNICVCYVSIFNQNNLNCNQNCSQ